MALGAALFTSCNKDQSVALNESLVRLSIGDSMTLSASVEGSSKNKLTWKSSNTGVASVKDGVVTAIAEGSAVITASAGKASADCKVEVYPLPESITLSPASLTMRIGEMSLVTATVRPHRTLDKTVTWKSQNPDIAGVEDGWVLARAEGNTTITATAGNVTATLNVDVLPDMQELTVPYMEDFEDTTTFDNWTVTDMDGDGYGWYHTQKEYDATTLDKLETFTTHSGTGGVTSASYMNNLGALTPDNWLSTPLIRLNSGPNYLCYWLSYQDIYYKQEHYAVYISEYSELGPGAENCILLSEGTVTKGSLTSTYVRTETVTNPYNNNAYDWEMHVIRIPDEFNGKSVYISFRHFDCTDVFWINLDDVSITASDPRNSSAPAAASAPRNARPSGTHTSQTSYKIVR